MNPDRQTRGLRATRLPWLGVLLGPCILAGCAGGPSTGPTAGSERVTPEEPAWRALAEYRMLAETGTFEGSAVGFAGETPLSAVAFARLVLRDDSAAIFDDLLRQESLAARLYGLKGLWFVDRERYRREAASMALRDEEIPVSAGCIGGPASVRDLARDAPAEGFLNFCGPVGLFRAGCRWLEDADPQGGDSQSWASALLDPDHDEEYKLWAARALAYSLGSSGLQLLLESLPKLDEGLQSDVLHILENLPPWSRGALHAIDIVLDAGDPVVLQGAMRAIEALSMNGTFRPECHVLVPRLAELLAAYQPPEGGGEEGIDGDWPEALLRALKRIGGPAGPVLARALEHPAPAVRDRVSISWRNLGAWWMATRDELVKRLSHENPDVRARAIMQLAKGRALPDSHPIRAELRELEPELQRAIDSLEEPQRSEVTDFIESLTSEGSWTVEE